MAIGSPLAACNATKDSEPAPAQASASVAGQTPFSCRIVVPGDDEQKAAMIPLFVYESNPHLLTARSLRNPLEASLIRVEVQNNSGREVAIYGVDDDRPFWVTVLITDTRGRPVEFPHHGPPSLARIPPLPGFTHVVTIKPGQVVTQADSAWRYLNIWDLPEPGTYDVRVVCSYYGSPDGEDCRVTSAPLRIVVTEENIRDWRALQQALHEPPGINEVTEAPRPSPSEGRPRG